MNKQLEEVNVSRKGLIKPPLASMRTFHGLDHLSDRTLEDTTKLLGEYVKKVNQGDLSVIEEMLTIQFFSLNALFNKQAEIGSQFAHTKEGVRILRLALKAQNQCRVTAETLANLKNPKSATFVKQANIGFNQQVNNSFDSEKNKNPPNELLEPNNG